MNDLGSYFFKLVCVNENNPLEYEVLEDVNLSNLENVHSFVKKYFEIHNMPEMTKWLLLPMKKMI